ncbi:MAG: thiopurine S-methyltransferase [Wenzhouxiangella sp.]
MEPEFWRERWQRGEIGFHRDDVHWALKKYWDPVTHGSRDPVFVPLCGKSLDMRWLHQRGHAVHGCELSRKAVMAFFDEWGREPESRTHDGFETWTANGIGIVIGDFFNLPDDVTYPLFYDRASLIALPAEMRPDYLAKLKKLLAEDARGLLVTFEYDQSQMDGPPFSVEADELERFDGFEFELLERRDVLDDHPRFATKGLTTLHECAWRVTPRRA